MSNYYASKLNSQTLFQVYDTKIPRIQQYLSAEIDFVRSRLSGSECILEIAAGYGRIIRELAPYCKSILGMDISHENIELSKDYLEEHPNAEMLVMDVHNMHFTTLFDCVLCLQNGLSAIRATPKDINSMLKLLAPGGTAYFSTYSNRFWDWRVKWFEEQAQKGCLGPIDYEQTKDGIIVCKDGFRGTIQSKEELKAIGESSGFPYKLVEVDNSSLFLIIHRKG